jgi:hypothetical protein
MQWNRENDAAVAKYKKETFDKIFTNEIARDAGMRQFYVDPTTPDATPKKPDGFMAAGDFTDIQLGDNEAGLDI